MIKITKLKQKEDVYDLTVSDNHNFYSNNILVHNCVEINLPTSPLNHIDDGKRDDKLIKIKVDKASLLDDFMKMNDDIYVKGESNELLTKTDLFKVLDYNKKKEGTIDNNGNLYLKRSVERVYGDKPGEIALCVLSAINVGEVKELGDLESITENIVRALDFVITHQDYPLEGAKKMYKRRSVGIGITNLAYFLAKNDASYESQEALELVDELMEHIQYYCIKASVKLAKEFGPCEWFHRTKYSEGILPIDTYDKNVDKIIKREKTLD